MDTFILVKNKDIENNILFVTNFFVVSPMDVNKIIIHF